MDVIFTIHHVGYSEEMSRCANAAASATQLLDTQPTLFSLLRGIFVRIY